MRYMARRVRTGLWVDREVPLQAAERTETLSGPYQINARLPPEYNRQIARDGRRILDDQWSTIIYAVRPNGSIEGGAFVLPAGEYAAETSIQCAGLTAYPQRLRFTDRVLYGPANKTAAKAGKPSRPAIPRPDPVFVYRDLWARLQAVPGQNIGVTITGPTSSDVRIGNNAEPVRFRDYETPNIGEALTSMAEATPFDYQEVCRFVGDDVAHEVNIAIPRLGRFRNDLVLTEGDNIAEPVVVTSVDTGSFIIGVGKGDPPGPSMVYVSAPVDSQDTISLPTHRLLTDKTLSEAQMKRRVAVYQRILREKFDVTSVTVSEHENAPLGAISVGDDLPLRFDHPDFGAVSTRVRVLSVTRSEAENIAVLSTSRSVFFVYDHLTEVLDS